MIAATQQPPQDVLAERSVLGAILIAPELLRVAQEAAIEPHHFFKPPHSILMKTFIAMYAAEQPIDTVTVREWLVRTGELDRVGGDEYLLQLTDTIPNQANVRAHAASVVHKAILRQVKHELQQGAAAAQAGELEDAREAARRVLEQRADTSVAVLSTHDVALRALQPRSAHHGYVRTGYVILDGAIRAMPPSTMMTLGGRTGSGKSTLMLGMALHAARAGLHPGIVSLEDAEDVWGARALAQLEPDLSAEHLIAHQLDFRSHAAAQRGLELAKRAGVRFTFCLARRALQDVLAAIRALCAGGCNVILVDYVQAIALGLRHEQRIAVSHAAQQVNSETKAHGAVLVLGSQLKRADESKPFAEPHAGHLKETGDLENMSDVVLLNWKTSDESDARCLGKIAKIKWSRWRPRYELDFASNGALKDLIDYTPQPLATQRGKVWA